MNIQISSTNKQYSMINLYFICLYISNHGSKIELKKSKRKSSNYIIKNKKRLNFKRFIITIKLLVLLLLL